MASLNLWPVLELLALFGEYGDVDLIDITPHGDVEAAAGGQWPHRIDLGDHRIADPAALAWSGNVRDREVEHLVLAVAAGRPAEKRLAWPAAACSSTTG